MTLSFLPPNINREIDKLNADYLSEIRLRCGQPVIIQYQGEYKYITADGLSDSADRAVICDNVQKILFNAMEDSVYSYTDQLKYGFVTVCGGVRIGVAGEYVLRDGDVLSIKNATSLNIRIPHDAVGCGKKIFEAVTVSGLKSTLIYSLPGFGKTTVLRDFARLISYMTRKNVLVFDERNELGAINGSGTGYFLGNTTDIVRGADKLTSFTNAIRAMNPEVIITDELYGQNDYEAIKKTIECGICVVASSHVTDAEILKKMPFEYYVNLTGIGKQAIVYDKAFNTVCHCDTFRDAGNGAFERKKAPDENFLPIL